MEYLEVAGGSTASPARVQQNTCDFSFNGLKQRWWPIQLQVSTVSINK
jgi:hypothetical protein